MHGIKEIKMDFALGIFSGILLVEWIKRLIKIIKEPSEMIEMYINDEV